VRQGYLTATPGPVIRNDFVAKDLVDDSRRFNLAAVAYDRWLIKDFETALGELGAELPLVEHGQGFAQRKGCPENCPIRHEHKPAPLWMPQSITELETLILEKRIRVAINPALRSAVASARFYTSPAALRRFEKASVGGRIDMCVALTMGVGAAVANTDPGMGHVNLNDLVVI
jgi:phage terminase large subunit-like protein